MRIFVLFIVISFVLNIIASIAGKGDDGEGSNGGEKKKTLWVVVRGLLLGASAIIALLVNGVLDINSLELDKPDYAINEEQTGVYLTAPENNIEIEYRVKTEDVGQPEWEKYTEGNEINITHNPTKLEFRSKYYWKTSDVVEKTCHINEYGQVWIDIPPDIPITAISAIYQKKEPKDGHPGNTYAGYTISKGDIVVTGTDTKGNDDISIKGFTFTPSKLKEGENPIEIEYVTDNGQKHNCTVTVYGSAPELLSINAKLRNKDEKILIGTTLTADMFIVTGTYENGEKKQVDNFLIDPVTVDDEREYTVKISKGNISDSLKIEVIDPAHISESEVEDNNSIETANNIELNGRYTGKLSYEDDVDYYRVRVKEKGSVQIIFSHQKIDSSSHYWVIHLLGEAETVFKESCSGSTSELQTVLARVSPGVYYVKIESYYYSNTDYIFTLVYNPEDDYYESEPNDGISLATAIETNAESQYTGNMTSDEDKDYYSFSIPTKGKVGVQFDHRKWDNGSVFWKVSVLDDTDYTVTSLSVRGNSSSEATNYIRLPAGTYYIRIESYYWSNRDYHFSVQYYAEDDEAESEPNDDYDDATVLELNQEIVGNIQSEDDTDFYELNLEETDELTIIFRHDKFDNSSSFWKIELFDLSSDPVASKEGVNYYYISGDDSSELMFEWQGLDAGKYYIKISPYYFDNDDYHLLISS